MNIFLDDIRTPRMSHNENKGLGPYYSLSDNWVIIRDYFEFIDLVNERFDEIELISFDHDLGCFKDNKEFTGKDAANFLINYCLDNDKRFPNWYVHSDNTVGSANIIGLIINYLRVKENIEVNMRYYNKGLVDNNPVI